MQSDFPAPPASSDPVAAGVDLGAQELKEAEPSEGLSCLLCARFPLQGSL